MRAALASLLVVLLVYSVGAQEKAKSDAKAEAKAKAESGLRDKINVETDVEYANAGEVSLKLDIYKPKTESARPRPCIVWIHGGGWQGGNKSSGLARLGSLVASGDYVGVSVGYRLTDVAGFPAQIHDSKAAIRFVRANASKLGIDPNKIGVWGSSAGGHLVSLLGTSGDVKEVEGTLGTTGVSSRVTCVVDYCGPSDFPAFELTSGAQGPVTKLLGGVPKEKLEVAKQASPITYVSKDDPPFLVVHGTNDATVPFDQAVRFHDALKKGEVDSTFVRIEGGGHGIGGAEVESRVKAFFEKHLLGKATQVSADPIQQPAAEPKAK
jgi:acetyl esterase/lipase